MANPISSIDDILAALPDVRLAMGAKIAERIAVGGAIAGRGAECLAGSVRRSPHSVRVVVGRDLHW